MCAVHGEHAGVLPFNACRAGHSLGGAVATLAAIRLLSTLPRHLHSTLSVVGFATPPVGNAALAMAVSEAGWDERIVNYAMPGEALASPCTSGLQRRLGAATGAAGIAGQAQLQSRESPGAGQHLDS